MKKVKFTHVVEETYEISDEIAEVLTDPRWWELPEAQQQLWYDWMDAHGLVEVDNVEVFEC